jgi:UDPglucose 6-dehydrogenase
MSKPTIGFIGHGYVGKNYADNLEDRGYTVVRYSLEEPYVKNKDKVKECDIVFVAVPTPTTPKGFDSSIVEGALKLIKKGATVVIKSTILPGTTKRLQKKFPHLTLMFSPEFLSVATARQDTDSPFVCVIGIPVDDEQHRKAADMMHGILPKAPLHLTCTSEEAEIYKYAHNINGYTQILAFNLMYDLALHHKADWARIEKALKADPYIPTRYATPVHKSGRGAGGGCFIKDMAAFSHHYRAVLKNKQAHAFLQAAERHNISLLVGTNKDLDLLSGVYGKKVAGSKKKATKAKTSKKR